MKMIVLEMLCGLLVACSCTKEGTDGFGRPRGSVDAWRKRMAAERVESLSDTVVYASALKYEEGYDWKTDSLSILPTLVLIRNGVSILELPTGPGGRAGRGMDTHTIIGGHLVSWVGNGSVTTFFKDGEMLFSHEDTEMVKGLLESASGAVWTLGQSGGRWALRKNGTTQAEGEGIVVGDLLCDCCPSSGALYMDRGSMCFCYTTERGGRRSWFLVQDGKTTQVTDEGIITDIKMAGGILNIATLRESSGTGMLIKGKEAVKIPTYSGSTWKDMRILRSDARGYMLSGFMTSEGRVSAAVCSSTGAISSYGHTGHIVFQDNRWYCIFKEDGDLVLMPYRKSNAIRVAGNPYFPSSRCAAFLGEDLYYAISPLPGAGNPVIMKNTGDKAFEMEFNGFVTGISIGTERLAVP